VRNLAAVPWKPSRTEAPPPHRVDRYAFRAGELRRLDGEKTGYVLVLPMAYWTQIGGHLWWRRWSDPWVGVDVWISADGVEPAYNDAWWSGSSLDGEIDLWDSGRLTVGAGSLQAVRWLDEGASGVAARQTFDVDLVELQVERAGCKAAP
jgi:hypothetical protein